MSSEIARRRWRSPSGTSLFRHSDFRESGPTSQSWHASLWIVNVADEVRRYALAREGEQERPEVALLARRQLERPDLLRAAEERARGIATAVVEVDDFVEGGGLAVAEVGAGLGDLAQSLGSPEPHRDGPAAEVAISGGGGIVAEVAVDVEVSVGNGRIADQRLVERSTDLVGIGVGRSGGIDREADDVEVVVGQQRGIVAAYATGLADKQLEAAACVGADRAMIAGDEAIERGIAADRFVAWRQRE